jgi:hypothetical protein
MRITKPQSSLRDLHPNLQGHILFSPVGHVLGPGEALQDLVLLLLISSHDPKLIRGPSQQASEEGTKPLTVHKPIDTAYATSMRTTKLGDEGSKAF